jgi:MerR family transcriptional regulator/heat shock protein HspR
MPGKNSMPRRNKGSSTAVSSEERALYVISVAAELAGMHPQTLRIYERKGLLEPERTVGGSRRYRIKDIERLRHIQDLTNMGLNLEGVRMVMELEAEVERLRQELRQVKEEARQAIERTHKFYKRDVVPSGTRYPVPYAGGRVK